MKASENMDSEDWIKLAKQVKKSLEDENVKGVIVTHGTDFLHYSSAALSFFFPKSNKPIVLTYSQRSSDRGSSDAELNLLCSAKMALSDVAEVMLVGHATSSDDSCVALLGTKVRKMHSSRRDTFKPINCSPIAKITRSGIEILRGDYNKRGKSDVKFDSANFVFENKVALVKFYPGQNPEILEHYLSLGYRGVVIEMSGLGHVLTEGSNNWIPVIKELVKKGITICATAQTVYGRLDPLVYSPGRELEKAGVIYLKDILPQLLKR
jgi:glutamyl-tRNA(Gln) amidotransferase subunit D